MHHDLKHRIQAMRDKLEGRAPVAEIQGSSQLLSPLPECRRLVELADVRETDRILEPSAGTGAILQAIRDAVPRAKCDAVELHAGLARHLQAHFPEVRIWCGDFLEYHPERRYTRIIMNPPFNRGDDIRHIRRALTLLEPGGILTGICLDGPRQQRRWSPWRTSGSRCRGEHSRIPCSDRHSQNNRLMTR
ncbi:hypothetical protein BANRA_05385 [Klebsiella pneumoniae]|nr:hypothetical protein BANRA_05385 [Klebsiella pneumoniae]